MKTTITPLEIRVTIEMNGEEAQDFYSGLAELFRLQENADVLLVAQNNLITAVMSDAPESIKKQIKEDK